MRERTISDCGMRMSNWKKCWSARSRFAMRDPQFAMLRTLSILGLGLFSPVYAAEPEHFRLPAPQEDGGELVETATFGAAAGHEAADRSLHVMEWVAKRTWHIL